MRPSGGQASGGQASGGQASGGQETLLNIQSPLGEVSRLFVGRGLTTLCWARSHDSLLGEVSRLFVGRGLPTEPPIKSEEDYKQNGKEEKAQQGQETAADPIGQEPKDNRLSCRKEESRRSELERRVPLRVRRLETHGHPRHRDVRSYDRPGLHPEWAGRDERDPGAAAGDLPLSPPTAIPRTREYQCALPAPLAEYYSADRA